ncbi:MAG: protein-L-isoaspartate(D-aspartate) O-methyltransferase [Chloroflexota bacterium]|nr:protein-L-isoaspartate(D-aspartate) O-methyltransferase [Chloroflexota bacterium]MDE2941996.1 protein-L-isoaspartate(D-aspartate) O-methyltransferase [Chloroflexota bacterium]MDE3267094.1 protein-L-isoaspartate(D-aspartate) O-methyltransferase [Chloroflexota bacterium]
MERARERLFKSLRRQGKWKAALDAMARVPRELFVPEESRPQSYEDIPLPIAEGQTISQPYIVALMTHALDVRPGDRVLELGTGSGYQAAILSLMARKVYTVERVASLAESASALLRSLGYGNVEVHKAGRELGLPEQAPFDAIVVTAAAPRLPRSLMEQLAVGGRLVIPVGSQHEQWLMKVVRKKGGYATSSLGSCRFVPLLGKDAWS